MCTCRFKLGKESQKNIAQTWHLRRCGAKSQHENRCEPDVLLLQVLNSGQESQKSIAQYLSVPALRRVISTFANDPTGQFADWSNNPEVQLASSEGGISQSSIVLHHA